jgi:hypothetical protein
MKRFVTSLILLLSLTLSSALTANASSQWMWHGAFPWVYSHAESSWWYMKAGTDGKFLAWKQANGEWYFFSEASKQWVPVNGGGQVTDTTKPVITLTGSATITHEAATAYSDAGAVWTDTLDGNGTLAASGSVNVNVTGTYVLTYSKSDAAGNAATQVTRTVNVVDTTPPVVTLLGDANVTHILNTAWVDPGTTATDALDGNLSTQVVVSGIVGVNATGNYVLTYSVSDSAGNAAVPVTRGVQVILRTWDRRFGGGQVDIFSDVIATSDRGYLLVGSSGSDDDGDKSEARRGALDYWAVKIDSNGSKLWDKTFGGGGADYCQSVTATTDGGYLLAGRSDSPVGGDKSEGSRGSWDYWAIKIDANGTKLWDKRFGGSLIDYCHDVIATTDDGYLLAGWAYSSFWIVKVDASGAKVWDKRFGSDAICHSTIATADGGYLLAGSSYSDADADRSETSRGKADYWVVKIAADGSKVWDKRFGGSQVDTCHDVIATTDGGYLLVGSSESPVGGDKSEGSRGREDYWAIKIDANGTKLWDKRFGGSLSDVCNDVITTADGGYLLAGSSNSDADADKSEGTFGTWNYWAIKIDANGNKIWDKTFGPGFLSGTTRVVAADDGGYLLGCGQGSDYWVVKIDANGNKYSP